MLVDGARGRLSGGPIVSISTAGEISTPKRPTGIQALRISFAATKSRNGLHDHTSSALVGVSESYTTIFARTACCIIRGIVSSIQLAVQRSRCSSLVM